MISVWKAERATGGRSDVNPLRLVLAAWGPRRVVPAHKKLCVAAFEVITQEAQHGHLAESVWISITYQLPLYHTASRPGSVRMRFKKITAFVAIKSEPGVEAQCLLAAKKSGGVGRERLAALPQDAVRLLVHYPGYIMVVANTPGQ